MLHGKSVILRAVEKDDVSVTPLAIPLPAGPGSIPAVILLSGDAGELRQVVPVVAAIPQETGTASGPG